ncbi:arylamine N-acetyltransferase family protein [Amycolatopsis minnesotensis]|uniref:Arylamine N-acetyltransferase n=1 Tax=Amycolatopsis minnesotensis TaxID=337894 RepID=A0ABN2S4F1_9PSEU
MSEIWHGEQLDLDAYLAKVGFTGAVEPTAEALAALHAAHVGGIGFENVDMLLKRPYRLGVEDLQDKLVRRSRGATCSEHTTLFGAVLDRIGFGVTGLSGRILMGSGKIRPATHGLLRVETAETADTGRVWACDVGFGGGPLAPIELADGAEASSGVWSYRLAKGRTELGGERWTLSSVRDGAWIDIHAFTLDPRYPADYQLTSHFIATHPKSPFAGRLFAQRMLPESLLILDDTRLTVNTPDGVREERAIEPREIPSTLADAVGVTLDADEAAGLVAFLEAKRAREPVA